MINKFKNKSITVIERPRKDTISLMTKSSRSYKGMKSTRIKVVEILVDLMASVAEMSRPKKSFLSLGRCLFLGRGSQR